MTATGLIILVIAMNVCSYFVGKYLTLSKVWRCMVTSFGKEGSAPLSTDALEHHGVIRDLLRKI